MFYDLRILQDHKHRVQKRMKYREKKQSQQNLLQKPASSTGRIKPEELKEKEKSIPAKTICRN